MIHLRKRLTTLGGVIVALSVLVGGGPLGVAQDTTPMGTEAAHPAHIHQGMCAELGNVVFPLTNVGTVGTTGAGSEGTPGIDALPTRSESASGVETSFTLVDASLGEIVEGGHAINVHESEANIGNYIACGDIRGTIIPDPDVGGDPQLVIALRELNGSGYSGVAVLQEAGSGTEVTMYLVKNVAEGTPEVAGSGQGEEAGTVTVEISDFAYGPDTVTIPAGGTVTWTNRDAAPHTATARDREVLQSGTLEQGESFSQTFATPGSYEYFCEFHAGMKGTIIVE